MRVALYSENMWLYPDLAPCGPRLEHVYLARGGHAGVQVALDRPGGPLSARLDLPDGVSARWYRMRPVRVERNSAPKIHTTLDHDLVKDFVTRQAPFEVYDLMEPIADPADMVLEPGRAVLFLRLCADAGMAPVNFAAAMRLRAGGETVALDIPLTVTAARVPPPAESGFSVNNWLNYDEMARVHGARIGTARWDSVLDAYLDHLLELRGTELKLPSGEPVRGALPCSCDEFDIARIDLHDPVRVEGDEQFSVLVCLSGKASVQTGTSSKGANASSEADSGAGRYPVAAGGVLLIPAELNTYFLVPEAADTVLLEASVRRVPEIAKDPTTLWQTPSE